MMIFMKILSIIDILLIACTLICGLWLKSHPQGDSGFHFKLSLITVCAALATIVLYMVFSKF